MEYSGQIPDIESVKPIRDIVYGYLREAILAGELKAGTRLIEREIGEKFKTSRTPVREALRKLETEGLLEYIPRKGDVVKGIDFSEIAEIYAIREALEILAVRAAIGNITDSETNSMKRFVTTMEDGCRDGDLAVVTQAFSQFDTVIWDAARMPRLKNMINNLQESLRHYRRMNLSNPKRCGQAIAEHRGILAAIEARNNEQAEKLVSAHIRAAKEQLLESLRR